MTVGTKMKTCLANLKSVQADLESFALETNNQMVKQTFTQFADQTKSIAEGLQARVLEIEEQEPQFKGS
ncbi:MAG: DUF1657 domain-containing protein [Firmicutes bacterium]|nr:DUF1657 domain-containing protein [Bacillota bacterium]